MLDADPLQFGLMLFELGNHRNAFHANYTRCCAFERKGKESQLQPAFQNPAMLRCQGVT